jgi:uncharacterized protein (DUF4415 family)
MRKEGNIVRYTLEELKELSRRGGTKTDLARIDAMTEEELEAAIASDPDWRDVPRDWHKDARPWLPKGAKRQVTLRLDPDLLDWFKGRGRGWQTRINAALRAYMQAHEREAGEGGG